MNIFFLLFRRLSSAVAVPGCCRVAAGCCRWSLARASRRWREEEGRGDRFKEDEEDESVISLLSFFFYFISFFFVTKIIEKEEEEEEEKKERKIDSLSLLFSLYLLLSLALSIIFFL